MCLNLCTVITQGKNALLLLVIVNISTDPGSVCDSPIASGPFECVHAYLDLPRVCESCPSILSFSQLKTIKGKRILFVYVNFIV